MSGGDPMPDTMIDPATFDGKWVDGGGYDHDVVSTSLDAVVDEGEALGFISPAVEREP